MSEGEGEEMEIFVMHTHGMSVFLISILLFVLAVATGKLLIQYFQITILPESALAILFGAVIGGIVFFWDKHFDVLEFDSDSFFLILLPPIIFEAGFHLKLSYFRENFFSIIVYAVIGTLFNTFLTGSFLSILRVVQKIFFLVLGLILYAANSLFSFEIDFVSILVFTSLISAVDPVAVLSIFEETHVNDTLNILVFGESVLNDAVSIVLYKVFLSLRESSSGGLESVELAVAKFLVVSFGGVFFGVFYSLLCLFFTKYTTSNHSLEPLFTFVFGMLSYVTTEIFECSGIVAVLVCGIILSNYSQWSYNEESKVTVDNMLRILAHTTESLIFVYLGISAVLHFGEEVDGEEKIDSAFKGMTFFAINVSRALVVFFLTWIINKRRMDKISKVNQTVMVYGGLRGAIAFALSVVLPEDFPGRLIILSTTLLIVFETIFLQGTTIESVLRLLHVKLGGGKEEAREKFAQHVLSQVYRPLQRGMYLVAGSHSMRVDWHHWWSRIDDFMKRYFVRSLVDDELNMLFHLDEMTHVHKQSHSRESSYSDLRKECGRSPSPSPAYPFSSEDIDSNITDTTPTPSPAPSGDEGQDSQGSGGEIGMHHRSHKASSTTSPSQHKHHHSHARPHSPTQHHHHHHHHHHHKHREAGGDAVPIQTQREHDHPSLKEKYHLQQYNKLAASPAVNLRRVMMAHIERRLRRQIKRAKQQSSGDGSRPLTPDTPPPSTVQVPRDISFSDLMRAQYQHQVQGKYAFTAPQRRRPPTENKIPIYRQDQREWKSHHLQNLVSRHRKVKTPCFTHLSSRPSSRSGSPALHPHQHPHPHGPSLLYPPTGSRPPSRNSLLPLSTTQVIGTHAPMHRGFPSASSITSHTHSHSHSHHLHPHSYAHPPHRPSSPLARGHRHSPSETGSVDSLAPLMAASSIEKGSSFADRNASISPADVEMQHIQNEEKENDLQTSTGRMRMRVDSSSEDEDEEWPNTAATTTATPSQDEMVGGGGELKGAVSPVGSSDPAEVQIDVADGVDEVDGAAGAAGADGAGDERLGPQLVIIEEEDELNSSKAGPPMGNMSENLDSYSELV